MSLLRLLATGKSLIGIRDKAGRYKVSEKNRLPVFEAGTSAVSKAAAAQQPEPSPRQGKPSRGRRWLPWPRFGKDTNAQRRTVPVQGELSLAQVRVVRNDLSDSDVEVVAARSAVTARAPKASASPGSGQAELGPLAASESAPAQGESSATEALKA